MEKIKRIISGIGILLIVEKTKIGIKEEGSIDIIDLIARTRKNRKNGG